MQPYANKHAGLVHKQWTNQIFSHIFSVGALNNDKWKDINKEKNY